MHQGNLVKVYSKKINGEDFICAKIGKVDKPLFPKGMPKELDQKNLSKLFLELQRIEAKQLKQNQKAREELLAFFDLFYSR